VIINGEIGHELHNVNLLLPNFPNMFPWKLKCLKENTHLVLSCLSP
jgi:hypothetical protein